MEPFSNLKSKPVPLDIVNVDTDQIIPKTIPQTLGKDWIWKIFIL